MNTVKFPKEYQQVMPYLIVKNANGFSAFMQKTFDAKEALRKMRDENCIQHAEVRIGECTIMFADSTEHYEPQHASLFIYVDDADARYQKAIAEGATSVEAMRDREYGRSGGILDPYGNTWWITSVK